MKRAIFSTGCSIAALMTITSSTYADNACEEPCKPPFCRSPCQCNCPPCEPRDYCCDPFQIGDEELPCKCCPAAYNATAAIEVNGWDVFVDGSFIFWRADQDNMELAKSAAAPGPGFLIVPSNTTRIAYPKTTYKPGFKAELGFERPCDGWVISGAYTSLHQVTHKTRSAPDSDQGVGVWMPNKWLSDAQATNGVFAGVDASSILTARWKLHFDMFDLNVSRPYYQGRALTVTPYGGLRFAWIKQLFNVRFESEFFPGIIFGHNNKSKNWGVGANMGLMAHWLMGAGFRFEGRTGASLLYTQFKAKHREKNTSNAVEGSIDNLDTLRPIAEAGLGLGWGSYFAGSTMHFDISARYDYMILWGQNIMRNLAGMLDNTSRSNPIGDLHLQGLTLTARMDF